MSYGAHENLKLLLRYGFALKGNEEAIVAFDAMDLVEGCAAARPSISRRGRMIFSSTYYY